MIEYSKYRPTAMDAKGLGLSEKQDWLVIDVMRTRDSEAAELSNWDATIASLEKRGNEKRDEEGYDDYECHSFRHWGPGWFEIILVEPGTHAERIATDIEAALADYPLLDDEDYFRREWEEHAKHVDSHCSYLERCSEDPEIEVDWDKFDATALCSSLMWDAHARSPDDESIVNEMLALGYAKEVPNEQQATS